MIEILAPGFYSTIQDLGRTGFQEYGVPYAGVMDRNAALMANSLVGNKASLAVMEITMTGPKLRFLCDADICMSGADISPKVNEKSVKINKRIALKSGDVLSFGKLNYGFRCYLAVSGGFDTDKTMQSYSMYQGITKRFVLSKSDVLPIKQKKALASNINAGIRVQDSYLFSETIEVYEGPEFELLSVAQKKLLFSQPFTISKNNNRMAYQLEEPLENDFKDIITSSVLPGTVQLTPSGKLIVLMRDCQTTGGYPRVLQLKETSIDVMAQKFTGQAIRFNLKPVPGQSQSYP